MQTQNITNNTYNIPEKVLENIKDVYLVSNTPNYLYKNLREIKFVKRLALTHTPDELVDAIDNIDKKENINAYDAAKAYAYLVALTYMNFGDVCDELSRLNVTSLKWIAQIFKIWDDTRVTSNSIKLDNDLSYRPVGEDNNSSGSKKSVNVDKFSDFEVEID